MTESRGPSNACLRKGSLSDVQRPSAGFSMFFSLKSPGHKDKKAFYRHYSLNLSVESGQNPCLTSKSSRRKHVRKVRRIKKPEDFSPGFFIHEFYHTRHLPGGRILPWRKFRPSFCHQYLLFPGFQVSSRQECRRISWRW